MITRPAEQRDVPFLTRIHASCFDQPWSHETLSEFVSADQVIVCGDPPTGFVIASHVGEEAEVVTIAIDPSSRQQGQGSALLEASFAHLIGQNVQRIFLEVAEDNIAARGLYAVLGFAQIGRRKAYYTRSSGATMDALVLSRQLTP
jgi:[ribosomal protein S18]-alanine N-acetyltransferase